ncbi:carbohydrate ABC transporter permease [Mesomycoplasma ovipneumoniae]
MLIVNKESVKTVLFHKNTKAILLIGPLFIFLFIFSVYPILDSLFNSFNVGVGQNKHLGFDNFRELFAKSNFNDALRNSTLLFFISSPIALFLGFIIAILLSKLKSKFLRMLIITGLYSQFFISSFAIGTAFSFLFGQKNVFAKMLNLNFSFVGGDNKIDLIWLYLIYQLWRAIPFNSVLFFFAISSIHTKYQKNLQIDRINLKDKIFNLYFKEIGNQFLVIAYTNFIFATMLYPNVITGDINLDLNRGHTLASYILSSSDNSGLQSAVSLMTFFYLLAVFSTFIIFRPKTWKKIAKLIKNKRSKNVIKI